MVRFLPLFVGIMPVAGVTVAYLLNVEANILPSCFPLLEGCTSISSTGRQMPGSLVFRAVMLPQAAFLVGLWWLAAAWLRQLTPASRLFRPMQGCGIVGAIALVVYVTFLGTKAPFYEFMRHFGIYFYFLGTALAQILLSLAINRSTLRTGMLCLIATPFILGIANLVQKRLVAEPDLIENGIEWTAAVFMQLWFVLLFFAWRATGLKVRIETDVS